MPGEADHGEPGWDDSGGDGGENAARLSDAVRLSQSPGDGQPIVRDRIATDR